jgi:hypothetical protein
MKVILRKVLYISRTYHHTLSHASALTGINISFNLVCLYVHQVFAMYCWEVKSTRLEWTKTSSILWKSVSHTDSIRKYSKCNVFIQSYLIGIYIMLLFCFRPSKIEWLCPPPISFIKYVAEYTYITQDKGTWEVNVNSDVYSNTKLNPDKSKITSPPIIHKQAWDGQSLNEETLFVRQVLLQTPTFFTQLLILGLFLHRKSIQSSKLLYHSPQVS